MHEHKTVKEVPENAKENIQEQFYKDIERLKNAIKWENSLYDDIGKCRKQIKNIAALVNELRKQSKASTVFSTVFNDPDMNEVIANIELSYRHLEDASMRLGKTLQALDGGISVYDRTDTVGVE